MTDCIFCKIVAGEMESDQVYQDEKVTVFHDINPAAPVHLLVIPNKHITSVQDLEEDDRALMGHMFSVINMVAEEFDVSQSGFRLIINNGPDAHQEVPHLHIHVLGGHKMRHPMG